MHRQYQFTQDGLRTRIYDMQCQSNQTGYCAPIAHQAENDKHALRQWKRINHLRTKLEVDFPPAVLRRPLTWAVLRLLLSQLSLELRPVFEAFGGRDGLDFF